MLMAMIARALLLAALALSAGLLFPRCHTPLQIGPDDVVLGLGEHRYLWEGEWLDWPAETPLGNTHGGFAFDSQGRILFSTDAEHAIVVTNTSGEVLDRWGAEIRGGVHSICLVQENGADVLYLPHHGAGMVYKYSLAGEQLASYPAPPESGLYEQEGRFKPTAVAVRGDGGFYIADGYGQSVIHRYSADGVYMTTIGTRGTEPGQFVTPHGLHWDEERQQLLVADRENHRIQFLDEDGAPVRVLEGMFRRPCSVQVRGDDLLVADLAGRVTIVSLSGERVFQLGDQPNPDLRAKHGVPVEQWRDGIFTAPHGAGWDQDGNLYVQDWNPNGRVTRLTRIR